MTSGQPFTPTNAIGPLGSVIRKALKKRKLFQLTIQQGKRCLGDSGCLQRMDYANP
jgi:hypothetical protein